MKINPHNIPLISFVNCSFKITLFSTILNNFIFCILNINYQWLFTKIFFIGISWLPNQFSGFVIQYIIVISLGDILILNYLLVQLCILDFIILLIYTLIIHLLIYAYIIGLYLTFNCIFNLILLLLLWVNWSIFILGNWRIFRIKIEFKWFI